MFKTEKNGYSKADVEAYIKRLVMDNDKVVMDLKMKNLEQSKQLLDGSKQDKQDNISETLSEALEKAKQIETSWRNIYKLKIQQLDLLYARFQAMFTECLQRYPQLESIGNIKEIIEDFKSAVQIALQEDFSNKITSPVKTDNDTIRRLLSKMSTYSKQQDEVKVVKIKRSTKPKKDIYFEDNNIKPIADTVVGKEENYSCPADKFLDEEAVATYSNFLSKNDKNDLSPNESGFDLKEAVNPTEDLEEIMKAFNFFNEN